MQKASGKGVIHLFQALRWSLLGLRAAVRHEEAFRQELVACVIMVPLGLWLGENGTERALLIGSLVIVLMVEVLNSAIEAAVDRIGEDHHPLSGRAKDLGSAAVFLSLVNAGVIWLLILFG